MQPASYRSDLIIVLYFAGGKYLCFFQFLLSLFINWWKKQDSQYLGHENQEHQEDVQGLPFQLENNFRMVPTFVSVHISCASRKACFKCYMGTGVTLTHSTLLPSTRLKLKQNLPTLTKSSLMNLYINQEQHIANN